MDRGEVLPFLSMIFPDVRKTQPYTGSLNRYYMQINRYYISQARNVLSSLQPKDHWVAELVADEYLGTSGDRVEIRNGFTQMIGDVLFTVAAIKTANAHKGRLQLAFYKGQSYFSCNGCTMTAEGHL